ncbi:hypothetical protein LIER_25634 [Lithospermum erythrorhizon]|uniref:B3 domain-containing protein n=1 Tax=Lithospermum erythrorhizon TaxID=34254 RepID=A0AAV3R8V1_LITER
MVTYEDVKHLEGKVNFSKLDILAEVAAIASKLYYSSKNNKRKSPSSSLDFLASSDEIPRKKRCLRKPWNEKDNTNSLGSYSSSESEKRKEWALLENPIITDEKNNTNCSSGLKLKFKLNTGNNQERAITTSGSEILANGPPRVDVNNQGAPLSGLPEYLQQRVLELGGGRQVSECILVVKKKLFMSDVKDQQSRFLIPHTQMREFLKEHEKPALPFDVQIIEPFYQERTDNVVLVQWGNNLVLRETWNRIVERNGLQIGSNLQLWAVRYDDGQLVFVLVDVAGGI